jgi:site-specific DNA recombinase
MRAATYVRVSTEEQAENGTSLDTQREQARSYVAARGWTLTGEYEDAGISGTKDEREREGLRSLMQAARSGEVEVVVVTKVDRFSRSMAQFARSVEELDNLGVSFVSVTEGFDSTQLTGQLMRNMLAAFAQFEHGRIAERMTQGRRAVKAQGYWTGGSVPFGFRPVEDAGNPHKRLVLDEFNTETIRLAVSFLLDKGCTMHETAEHLNALDRPTALGKRWDSILLRHMLKRTMLVPEILDQARFDLVQTSIKGTSLKRRPRDNVYPLSLRILGTCGAAFHGIYRKELGLRFYSCNNKKWENREQRCDDLSIRADDIEYVVWEQVCDLLSKPERLVALAEEYLGLRGKQIEVERDEYEETVRKVARLDDAIQNLLVTSAKAGLAPKDIEAAVIDLTRERDALRKHLAMIEAWRADSQQASNRMRRLWALAEEAHRRLPNMTPQEQKQILDLLDVRVTVVKHAQKSAGGRVLEPAQIRIEGLVNDQVLLSAESPARDINEASSPAGSARVRAAAAWPRGSRAHP